MNSKKAIKQPKLHIKLKQSNKKPQQKTAVQRAVPPRHTHRLESNSSFLYIFHLYEQHSGLLTISFHLLTSYYMAFSHYLEMRWTDMYGWI